ncbi:MAG: cysteine hydrolase [Syntrophales bacterium LBB04]|nr:cysteine hydrolase [Syntrophales bacterium LBB04]
MKTAVIVVDMLKDHIREANHPPAQVMAIIPSINRLTERARQCGLPVIFANDSFLPGDFIFQGKIKGHALRGTEGAEVVDELAQEEGDIYLPKRRFSAFFKTDLDQTLRLYGVEVIAIAGINSHWCVLDTAFDAMSNDFRAYIISDCCASFHPGAHETTMDLYRKNPLYPLFQVMTLQEFEKTLPPV